MRDILAYLGTTVDEPPKGLQWAYIGSHPLTLGGSHPVQYGLGLSPLVHLHIIGHWWQFRGIGGLVRPCLAMPFMGRGFGVFGVVWGLNLGGGGLSDIYIFRIIRTVCLCQFLINPWRVET